MEDGRQTLFGNIFREVVCLCVETVFKYNSGKTLYFGCVYTLKYISVHIKVDSMCEKSNVL